MPGSKPRRKFSVEQKLQIIQEADQHGIMQTLRKHNLSNSVLLRWKNQFNRGGAGSSPRYNKIDPELKALQEENARLKKTTGNQALVLEFKTELLKKAMPIGASGNPGSAIPGPGIHTRRLLNWSMVSSGIYNYKPSGGQIMDVYSRKVTLDHNLFLQV